MSYFDDNEDRLIYGPRRRRVAGALVRRAPDPNEFFEDITTMATLETTLQQAAANGLRGLTLYPVDGGRWQASRTLDGTGWRVGIADDPVTAVLSVIGDSLPLADEPKAEAPAPADEDIFG